MRTRVRATLVATYRTTFFALAASLATLLVSACATQSSDKSTLYRALGEREGIERIADNFLAQLADNEQVLPLFLNTDIVRFRTQFIDHLCEVADGPCEYTGDSMAATHRGMNISKAQFNTVVENLIDAMELSDIPTSAQNGVLQRFAPMYGDIAGQ